MKNSIRNVLFVAFLLGQILSSAQTVLPLKIGDNIPDLELKKMLNHQSSSGKLSDFTGKAIIIDLWFKECVPCIASMPHLDSIQKKFNKDLQILPVTWQSKDAIEQFWKNNLDVGELKFTQVVEDTVVRRLFPARSFPHQIWLDKNRKVIAITDGKNLTIDNIKKLINGQNIALQKKTDENDNSVANALLPNMVNRYEQNKNKILYYSYLSNYRKELSGWTRVEKDTLTQTIRVLANNIDLLGLYNFAYTNNSGATVHYKTRILRKDHNPVKTMQDGKFDTTASFCYELIYRGHYRDFGKYMIKDLDRSFKVRSHEELIELPCYVIRSTGNDTRYRNPNPAYSGRQTKNIALKKDALLVANMQWISFLERALNQGSGNQRNFPIVFELPNEKTINFEVNWNLEKLDTMNRELAKYDLMIEFVKRKRKVIVLEDL